ncbi:MAG: hypothetical protein D4R45_07720 [Planctomycetaceae bacterium]|nr:MAG: hypothetical protein D4R45_07720 [Planctomycetaceae bacterium]
MDKEERGEVREMIHGILSGWQAQTVAREELTNVHLSGIRDHLERLNGSVKNNADDIEDNKEEIDCLKLKIAVDKEIKKRWWQKYKHTLELLAVLAAFLTLFYMNWSDNHLSKKIERKTEVTNQILTPEAVRRGFNLDSLGLND